MIFHAEAVCNCVFCVELLPDSPALLLPGADMCIVLISRGEARLVAAGRAYALRAGELLCARGEIYAEPLGECHLVAAGLSGMAACEAARALAEPLRSDGAFCPMTGQLLADLLELPDAAGETARSEAAYRLLCSVAQADAQGTALPALVAEAVHAIQQNYAGLYGVEELSTQLGVSKSHLVRVFAAALGMTPGRYLTAVRIDAAKRLLAQRTYSLEIIASLCGFSGANYFCKVFKKATGTTPAAYREKSSHALPPEASPTPQTPENLMYL